MKTDETKDTVRALARGLSVIEAFGMSAQGRTLADLSNHVGLDRATVRRILITLIELGFAKTDGRMFVLTPKILTLSYAYLSSVAATDILMPHMESVLEGTTHVASSAAMLDSTDAIFIAGVPAKGLLRTAMTIGLRFPAVVTAMGRVLLSQLDPAERDRLLGLSTFAQLTRYTCTDPAELKRMIEVAFINGYAICDRELDVTLKTCAVPIFGRDGRCWASMSVNCYNQERNVDDFTAEFLPKLRLAAQRVTASLPSSPMNMMRSTASF